MITVLARTLLHCTSDEEHLVYRDSKKNPNFHDLLADIQSKARITKPLTRLFTPSLSPILTVAGTLESKSLIAACSGEAGHPLRRHSSAAPSRNHHLREDPWAARLTKVSFAPPKPPMCTLKLRRTSSSSASVETVKLPTTILKSTLASTVLDRISKALSASVDALFDANTGKPIVDPSVLNTNKSDLLYACSGDPWPLLSSQSTSPSRRHHRRRKQAALEA